MQEREQLLLLYLWRFVRCGRMEEVCVCCAASTRAKSNTPYKPRNLDLWPHALGRAGPRSLLLRGRRGNAIRRRP